MGMAEVVIYAAFIVALILVMAYPAMLIGGAFAWWVLRD